MMLALLFSAHALVAANNITKVVGLESCEEWRTLPLQGQIMWLHGFTVGVPFAAAKANSEGCTQSILRESGALGRGAVGSIKQIAAVMTNLCADPANTNIYWSEMAVVAANKLAGEDVETQLRILRAVAAQQIR
jgi:hypothetical protein